MKVYSLYLSTLTGCTINAVFTGTVSGLTLTVTTVTSGSIAVGQYVVINGVVNSIASGSGPYTLTNSVSSNITNASQFISYTPASQLPKYAPTNKTIGANLNAMKFSINWKEIFGNRIGNARVRVRFISSSGSLLNWNANIGSLRGSLMSNFSNCTNGFNLGSVRPQSDYTATSGTYAYLDVDTTTSNGASIIIPNSNQDFYLNVVNSSENPMSNVPEYQIWLLFDADNEDPYTSNDTFSSNANTFVPTIFNPR
jgi:hypothetical protein